MPELGEIQPLSSIYKTPGTSPYPFFLLAFATPLTSLGMASFPLSGAILMSSAAIHYDRDSGPSTATAWGLIYFTIFSRHATKNTGGKIFTAAIAAATYFHAREVMEDYF